MTDTRFVPAHGLTIDGITYSAPELVIWANRQLEIRHGDWMRDICEFLLQWCNPEPFVTGSTSGSTGKPKLLKLSKNAMIASAKRTIEAFQLAPGTRALICLPVRYIAGRMMLVRAMVGQWNVTLCAPEVKALLHIPHQYQFTAMVPHQAMQCAEAQMDLSRFGILLLGGAAVPASLVGLLKGVAAFESYGMTETVSHIALRKVGEVWFKSLPGIGLTVNREGCLVIDAPDLTDAPLTTRDLVEMAPDGRFRLLGRADWVINSGGIKLFPEQMEQRAAPLFRGPFAFVPLSHPTLGTQVCLAVTPAEELDEAFYGQLAQVLSRYEMPKKTVVCTEWPLTPGGKTDRLRVVALVTTTR